MGDAGGRAEGRGPRSAFVGAGWNLCLAIGLTVTIVVAHNPLFLLLGVLVVALLGAATYNFGFGRSLVVVDNGSVTVRNIWSTVSLSSSQIRRAAWRERAMPLPIAILRGQRRYRVVELSLDSGHEIELDCTRTAPVSWNSAVSFRRDGEVETSLSDVLVALKVLSA